MKPKIVKLEINDNELMGTEKYLETYYLVNPSPAKLDLLKHTIEHRFDYLSNPDISDEDFEKAEELCGNIWDAIDLFVNTNFVVLDIDEIYEIAY